MEVATNSMVDLSVKEKKKEEEFSAVSLINDVLTSETTRNAIQHLFEAIANKNNEQETLKSNLKSKDKWIEKICEHGNDESSKKQTEAARVALLKVVVFLKCAQGTEEAEDFLDSILSIGSLGETQSAKMIAAALQDPKTTKSLHVLASSLKEPEKEKVSNALDGVIAVFQTHSGTQQAADDIATQMGSLNEEDSFVSEILKRFEENFQKDEEDLIKMASKDPLSFATKLIRYVLWPVLSERLVRIEVPDIVDNKGKDTYEMREILIFVTDFPKNVTLDVRSTLNMEINGQEMSNGGSEMVATLSANDIAAKSSIIAFKFDKNSFPSVHDGGDLHVNILPPGFDLSVAVIVKQPPGEDSPAIFQGGEVKCNLKSFSVTFHENVRNERFFNTIGRWFNAILRDAIAKAVSAHLRGLIADGFDILTRLLHAQQRLIAKVKEREEEMKLRKSSVFSTASSE